MLSILIPVYNFDINNLVKEIFRQCLKCKIEFEIILIDDCSDEYFKELNKNISIDSQIKYIQLKQNIGRAKIRNLLAKESIFPYLLFLDCDSEIVPSDFIQSYINFAEKSQVICGGRIYSEEKPANTDSYFHWYYGSKCESIPLKIRKQNTFKSFMTNNFLIKKDLFEQIKFNEIFTKYGHEDTFFGYELKKMQVNINHIDNPVLHLGLETTDKFLDKTKQGLHNLLLIYNSYKHEPLLINDIKILKYFKKFILFRRLFAFIFKLLENAMVSNLKGKCPSIKIFSFYKLGYLYHKICY